MLYSWNQYIYIFYFWLSSLFRFFYDILNVELENEQNSILFAICISYRFGIYKRNLYIKKSSLNKIKA